MAVCPKCDKLVGAVNLQTVTGTAPGGMRWKCVLHTCPLCHVVLNSQIDPIAIRSVRTTKKKPEPGPK